MSVYGEQIAHDNFTNSFFINVEPFGQNSDHWTLIVCQNSAYFAMCSRVHVVRRRDFQIITQSLSGIAKLTISFKNVRTRQTFITVRFLQHFERFCSCQFIFKTKLDHCLLLTMCFYDDRWKECIRKNLRATWCLIVQYWNFVSSFGRFSHLSHIHSATHTVLIKSVLKLNSHAVYI